MFVDILNNMNLTQVIQETNFKVILPIGAKKLANIFKHIAESDNSARVWIDGDCDTDGYLSARQIQLVFDAIGHTNYFITKHNYKRHVINEVYFNNVLKEENPDYIIILDSSSNSTDIMDICINKNKELIIIDHHDTYLTRSTLPNNITIINPRIDSNERNQVSPLNDLSCGALCSLLVEFIMQTQFSEDAYKLNGEHFICGYITLYSDSCPFSLYNIAYAKMVVNRRYPLPKYVECLYGKYSVLAKYFVSWTFVPRINAMIREEEFDMVYDFIFYYDKFIKKYSVDVIKNIHKKSKEYVTSLKEDSVLEDYETFKVAHLPNLTRARNYTGLVAQKFVEEYNLPCLGIMEANNIYYGSVRTPYDINLLDSFKFVCKADGHPSAFGIEIDKANYSNILYTIKNLIPPNKLECGINKDAIFLSIDKFASNDRELLNDLKLMGIYNEFSGNGLPPAYITLTLTSNHKIYRNDNYTNIVYGALRIICFNGYPDKGDKLVICPRYSNREIPELIVENIILGGKYV
jgi:single-stranded DNA-specific DHH superfamily exonuclease